LTVFVETSWKTFAENRSPWQEDSPAKMRPSPFGGSTMFKGSLLALCVAGMFWAENGTAQEATLKDLTKARLEVARKGLTTARTFRDSLVWLERILKAELALAETPADRITVLEEHFKRVRGVEASVMERYKQGGYSFGDVLDAQYNRLEAEAMLAEARGKAR
jgi:hypothetical protein